MAKTFRYLLVILFVLLFLIHPPELMAAVVINEMMPHPSSDNDWIELYKTTSEEADLNGWKLEDTTGVFETFAEGTKIASTSSFFLVTKSRRLNNTGDTVRLKDKNDTIIDEKSYGQDPGIDVALGRSPDGSDNWGILTTSSPNAPNANFAPTSTPTPTNIPTATPIFIPTNTPVPTSTPQPHNTPTLKVLPTSTKIPNKVVSPKLTVTLMPTSSQETQEEAVLGESVQTTEKPSLLLLILLIGGGVGCIGAAVVLSYKKIRKQNSYLS